MSIKVFRYTFSQHIMNDLLEFNRIHQFDIKEQYKEAWKKWLQGNQEILEQEERRLLEQGYEGDFMGKLYHASRYYVRNQVRGKKEEILLQKKQKYFPIPKSLIEHMDTFIKEQLKKESVKPSIMYNGFKDKYEHLMQDTNVAYKKGFMNKYYVLKTKIKGGDNI